jgi:hypothetical protein
MARASGLPDGMTAPVTKGFAIHERIKRTSSLLLNAERNGLLEIKIAPRQKNDRDHACAFCPPEYSITGSRRRQRL